MKATSTMKPSKFTFEQHPRGGYILWLRENYHAVTEEIEGAVYYGWVYDEYTVRMPFSLSEEFIEQHFDAYISEARKKEASDVNNRLTAAESAITDLAELIGGMLE